MREGLCESILQLDPNIRSVTRATDRLLENVQRCQYDDENVYPDEEPNETMFKVTHRTEGYRYELTGNASYCQLRFPINDNIISVIMDGMEVDVASLAENIVRLARIQQNPEAVAERHGYLVNRSPDSPDRVMHQS